MRKSSSPKLQLYRLLFYLATPLLVLVIMWETPDRLTGVFETFGTLQEMEEKLEKIDGLLVRAGDLKAERARIRSAMKAGESTVFEKSPIGVIEYLTTMSTKSGITISNLLPIANKDFGASLFSPLSFTLECLAGYHQFGSFLHDLEIGEFPVLVRQLSIKIGARRSGTGSKLEVLLRGETRFVKTWGIQ